MKIWKKVGVSVLIGVLLSASVGGLSACGGESKLASPESSVDAIDSSDTTAAPVENATSEAGLTQDTGANIAAELLKPRQSMAPAKLMVGETEIEPVLYDFWYYNHLDQYSQMIPQNEQGEPDLKAISMMKNDVDSWEETLDSLTMELIRQGVILGDRAEKNKTELDEMGLAEVENFFHAMEDEAVQRGVSNEEMLQSIYGVHATEESLRVVVENYFIASKEAEALLAEFVYTDDEVKAYFDDHKGVLGDWELPIVRHILFGSDVESTEDEDASAKAAADEVLAQIDAGEDMIPLGDTLAAEGKAVEAAEYTVQKGQMVPEFEDWCFAENRKEGDTGIVKTDYGYHVMKLTGFSSQVDAVRFAMQDEAYNEFMIEEGELPAYKIVKE